MLRDQNQKRFLASVIFFILFHALLARVELSFEIILILF